MHHLTTGGNGQLLTDKPYTRQTLEVRDMITPIIAHNQVMKKTTGSSSIGLSKIETVLMVTALALLITFMAMTMGLLMIMILG